MRQYPRGKQILLNRQTVQIVIRRSVSSVFLLLALKGNSLITTIKIEKNTIYP